MDAITFSGGIGENSAEIRSAVLRDLVELGIELDEDPQSSAQGRRRNLHRPFARSHILVVPANEELIVARETAAVVQQAVATQPIGIPQGKIMGTTR